MHSRRLITFLITLSLVSSAFYLPTFAPRAQAIFGFGDLVIDVKAMVERIVDTGGRLAAKALVDKMVQSTVNWAQSGFEGNPAYVTDPKQYFTSLSDNIAGEFIAGSDLGYLCSPFQTQVRLALRNQYLEGPQYQCSLTQVIGNIDAFYSDFNQGGWDAWFSMTQNSGNNPYGAYLQAQIELDSRIAESVGLQEQQLDWNSGFLSWADCIVPDPYTGECLKRGPTKTPGSVISEQLNNSLPAGLDRLVSAEHIDQVISAFANGLLNRYVFGPKGLFNNEPSTDTGPQIQLPPPTDLCGAAREIYGGQLDQNCNPISNSQQEPSSSGSGGVCATEEEKEQFLEDNPGDEGRLSSAFPC